MPVRCAPASAPTCSARARIGEFGPILLVTLILSTGHPLHEAAILVALHRPGRDHRDCSPCAPRGGDGRWSSGRSRPRSQLAVRLAVVLVFALVALAAQLGLDLLLGGFVAGMITRIALRGREVTVFDSKLYAVGYGLLIPFFFITSGMAFDLDALTSSATALLKVPMFLGLFLVVRGLPALLLYRSELDLRDRVALAVYSATELPLVVAITTLAIQAGHMTSSTAAGAGRRRDPLDADLPAGRGAHQARRRAGRRARSRLRPPPRHSLRPSAFPACRPDDDRAPSSSTCRCRVRGSR